MKTTRTLLAVVAAAGLALSGAGVASAAERPASSLDLAHAAAAGVGPAAAAGVGPGAAAASRGATVTTTSTVSTLAQLQTAIAAARPGDTITLKNGTYAVGSAVAVAGGGASGNPVTITAESVGGVTLTGASSFTFSGAHDVVLRGFRFTQSTTLEVPADSRAITFSRDEFAFAQSAEHNLIVRADDSVVEYSWFHGKSTIGVYLGIEGAGTTEMATGVKVHHNYFSDQSFAGKNGGECIRLGVSPRALSTAGAIVENNLFERANGDPETISVKSSGNTIRYNTVRDSFGGIVLRHGNGNTVVGNRIIGGANGIRIYGNDHVIVNNYVAGLSKEGIVIGSGTERDHYEGEPADDRQGNDAPDRIRIALNTLVDNGGGIIGETNRTVPPLNVTIVDNIVRGQTGYLGNVPLMQDFYWRGNIIWGAAANGNIPKVGFTRVDPQLAQDAVGTWKIAASSPAVNAATQANHADWVTDDLDGRARTGVYDIGAQEVTSSPATRAPLTTANVGPSAP